MIDVQTVVDYITAGTSYTAKIAPDVIPNLHENPTATEIFVGYTTITQKSPSTTLEYGVVNTNGEDLVQGFEIFILTPVTSFRTVWIAVYQLMTAWTPVASDKVHTRFTYNNGGRQATNVRMCHVDNWNIAFPTNKVLQ